MRRHVDAWLVVIAALVVGLVVLGLGEYLSEAAPAPLALPATAAGAPAIPLHGAWVLRPGAQARSRLDGHPLGPRGELAVGTGAKTGVMAFAGDRSTAGTLHVEVPASMSAAWMVLPLSPPAPRPRAPAPAP